jgi:hypothetical protein
MVLMAYVQSMLTGSYGNTEIAVLIDTCCTRAIVILLYPMECTGKLLKR